MGPVMDTRGLTVCVPGFDLAAARHDLRLSARSVATGQVDNRPGTEPRNQISAVAAVVRGRNHRASYVESFPAETVEDRLQDWRDAMVDQDVDDLVEVLEVLNVDLGQASVRQIMEADLKALINIAADRSSRLHVRLNTHQQNRVEALFLTIGCVCRDVLHGGSERHR